MSAQTNAPAIPATGAASTPTNALLAFYHSSVGKKVIMAITGIVGILYVFFHMAGNLQAFEGSEKINAYGAALHYSPMFLWTARTVLILAVIFHVMAAYQLARISQKSRPQNYTKWTAITSNFASRSMRWTGPLLLLFIIYHILHFTTGTLHPDYVEGDVYHNVVSAFLTPWVSAIYIVAMLALGVHLYHGIWSVFQSLGISQPRFDGALRMLATLLTFIIVLGFISIPVAVVAGLIG
jgi:succinate dehydrogenase / fumarate reductase cytochrome b subunit